jgi:hypothetical protein
MITGFFAAIMAGAALGLPRHPRITSAAICAALAAAAFFGAMQ